MKKPPGGIPSKQLVVRNIYYSAGDEESFFHWIQQIACITGWHGEGLDFYIELNDTIDDKSLRELIALSYRYNIGMSQLAGFETKENSAWFKDPQKDWYKPVFMSRENDIHVVLVDFSVPLVLLAGDSEAFNWLADEIEGGREILLGRKTQYDLRIIPSRGEGVLSSQAWGIIWEMSQGEAQIISKQLREFALDPSPSHIDLNPAHNAEGIQVMASKHEYDLSPFICNK